MDYIDNYNNYSTYTSNDYVSNYSNNENNNLINSEGNKPSLCRIYNYGSNCYMNSGLQIISRCDKFIEWINQSNYPDAECPFFNLLKTTLYHILYCDNDIFDPKIFMNYFNSKNKDFPPNTQNCSQLFFNSLS